MRKTILAVLAAASILLGVTGSAQAEELDANGHMLEFEPCMAAAAVKPDYLVGYDEEGTPIYSQKLPINWRQIAEAPCWRMYG